MRRTASLLSAVLAVVLVGTACGSRVDRDAYLRSLQQYQEVQPGAEQPGGSASTALPEQPGGAGTATTAGSQITAAPTGGTSTGKPGTTTKTSPLSTTVVGDTILIGFHVPKTGAAPMPTNWLDALEAIQEYLNTEVRPSGRKVKFLIEDDGYDATKGASACRKLADANPLFVIGHTMPAAQDACARQFNERLVPYLMRGTYPEILNGRPYSYFGTIPDDLQGRYLAQYVLKNYPSKAKKAAVVYQNDQISAKENFIATIKQGGGDVVAVELCVPKQPDWAAVIQKLVSAGAETVLLSMPPVDAIKISVQAQGQGYHPIWLGGGSWWNYNMALESAGMALDQAIVLSSWASIDTAAADEFKAVMRKYRPNSTADDIGLIMWGWSNLVRTAIEQAGKDLSRATFVDALNHLTFNKPYWHPITYTATNHRGASTSAVFRADGQAKRWRQITGFTSSF
ncbi:MAG: ABC transporter substrate-binding protein [Actinomycetota bacterium]